MKDKHQTFYFASRSDAWAFMRFVDEKANMIAGYPSLKPVTDDLGREAYTVETIWTERPIENHYDPTCAPCQFGECTGH